MVFVVFKQKILNSLQNHSATWVFLVISICTFLLRFLFIGKDSFWFDEAGQAAAAIQPRISDVITTVRNHAAAMPLDYLVSWVVAKLSVSEAVMRYPSAIWGTATVMVSYIFFKNHFHEKTALFAATLFSVSTIHIHYSQEMRFYASGVFFYWLTTLAVFNAVNSKKLFSWILLFFSAAAGSYFHPFVLLSLVVGPFLIMVDHNPKMTTALRFLVVVMLVFAFFLPGYVWFANETTMNYPVSVREIVFSIYAGLGWLPARGFAGIDILWGFLLCLMSLVGIIFTVIVKNRKLLAFTAAVCLQIIAISILVLTKGYFSAPRQYLFFLPLAIYLCSISFVIIVESIRSSRFKQFSKPIVLILLISFSLIVSRTLMNYYQFPKSNARDICALLLLEWQEGEEIWVVPWYEPALYAYYLENEFQDKQITNYLQGMEWSQMVSSLDKLKPDYIITSGSMIDGAVLQSSGYSILYQSPNTQSLWQNIR